MKVTIVKDYEFKGCADGCPYFGTGISSIERGNTWDICQHPALNPPGWRDIFGSENITTYQKRAFFKEKGAPDWCPCRDGIKKIE